MKGAVAEELDRVGQLGQRALYVVDQKGRHYRVGRLLERHPHGLEEAKAAVGRRKRLVVDHRNSGRRRSNLARDRLATGLVQHRAPVLDALGKGVVGTLRHHKTVNDGIVIDLGQRVLDAELEKCG